MAECDSPQKKRHKSGGNTKTVDQRYKDNYHKEFPVIMRSTKSVSHALCTLCNSHFSVAHGGLNDVKKHIKTISHKELTKTTSENRTISSMFVDRTSTDNVTKAEVLFTNFLVEHNIPIAAADHTRPLFKAMFPDSTIASKYGCARTKTTAVLETLADEDASAIASILKKNPFSLATDGSTDYDAIKLYPLVVRYYEPKVHQIVCVLLDLKELKGDSTGENIYNLLNGELLFRGVPWSNVISFGMDNASVMSGMNKGVAGFISRKQKSIYMSGCMCHLMHLAAEKGCSDLQKHLQMTVEDALIIVYYYLDKSSNRMRHLFELQQEHGTKPHKILKLVNTRWLSLNQCLRRMVEQWEPLKEFFKSEKEKALKSSKKPRWRHTESDKAPNTNSSAKCTSSSASKPSSSLHPSASASSGTMATFDVNTYLFDQQKRHSKKQEENERKIQEEKKKKEAESVPLKIQRICTFLDSRTSKLYCLFITAVLPLFEEGNLLLQKEEPVIHLMHSILTTQLRNLLVRFIKPGVIASNKDRLYTIDMSRDNHVEDEKLFIGNSAQVYLSENIGKFRLNKFYDSVRKFYVTSSQYMCHKFPYDDELLIKAKVLQIETRQQADFNDLLFFVDRYPCLLKEEGQDVLDRLQGQFLNYQVDDSIVVTDGDRIDTAWSVIGDMLDGNRLLRYDLLAGAMLGIATIFHSNADCERLFSYVTKNKTEFRSKLSTRTLSCLITHKVKMKAMGTKCFNAVPSKEVLRKAKSACYNKLMQ